MSFKKERQPENKGKTNFKKVQIPFCGHRKGHSPHSTPIGSLYSLLFVVKSVHTLFGPACLYSYSVIMVSGLWLFIVTSAHTLLGPVGCTTHLHLPYNTSTHMLCTQLLCKCCTWISSTDVHLKFSPAAVHSWTVYNCTLISASLAFHTIVQNQFSDVR